VIRKHLILIALLCMSIKCYSEIGVYEKKIISSKCLMFADQNLKIILGELKPNDEVKIIKSVEKNNEKIYIVEDEMGKKGIILENFTDEKKYPKRIIFNTSEYSELLYDFKYKKLFKKIDAGENFEIEEEPKSEDGQYFYFRNSLGFIIKLSKKDNYIIIKKINQEETVNEKEFVN
jgi:hypothetical protein